MSREFEDHRKRMEEKAAADLKAKLDMVTTKNRSKYGGRNGRKIGTMICDTGIKAGYRNHTVEFVLRLDATSGDFMAEHGDTLYVSKSREALKAKMDQVARVTFDLKWTRYLLIKYTATVPYKDRWASYGSTTHLDIGDKRDKNKPIFGVSLTWEVVEFSDPIRMPGTDTDRYMQRDVDDAGTPSDSQESVDGLPAGLVVYTEEREEMLKSIREAFRSIDAKMIELLGGTPEQVAKRLDSANGTLLLAPPTPSSEELKLLRKAEKAGWDSPEGMRLRKRAKEKR